MDFFKVKEYKTIHFSKLKILKNWIQLFFFASKSTRFKITVVVQLLYPPPAVWEQFLGHVSWCRKIYLRKKFSWTGGTAGGSKEIEQSRYLNLNGLFFIHSVKNYGVKENGFWSCFRPNKMAWFKYLGFMIIDSLI